LGHYTHRVAISNHRLVSLVDQKVTFRWRDSAHKNQHQLMTLSLDEFLRRFLLHLLPKGFVRIRHFGFLANRRRATLLPLCFRVLGAGQSSQTEPAASPAQEPSPLWLCPKCGGPMAVIERLTAAQLQLRSPPLLAGTTAGNYNSKLPHSVRLTTCRRDAPFFPSNHLPVFNLGSKSRPDPTQTTTKPILLALLLAPVPVPEAFLITSTPLNLHKRLPTTGSLQTAVSDAPRRTSRTYLPLIMGRIRYSTSVSRY
jgi:hypothetical protein